MVETSACQPKYAKAHARNSLLEQASASRRRLQPVASITETIYECSSAGFPWQTPIFVDLQINTGVEVRLLTEVELLGYQYNFSNSHQAVVRQMSAIPSSLLLRPPRDRR